MHLLIVAESYPSKGDPSFPFVQQLAYSLSNEGISVSVVASQSITKAIVRRLPIQKYKTVDYSPEHEEITVIRPKYISFSNTRNVLLKKLSTYLIKKAFARGIKSAGDIDAIYCYFWHIGLLTASIIGDTPLFVQASECEITITPEMRKAEYLDKVKGVVCASRKNLDESLEAQLTELSKCRVIVNGYRTDQFYKMDKREQRQKMGIPLEGFVIAFVGGFIERKGIDELCEALQRFDDVYSIFIGRGDHPPKCSNVLFQGAVEHEKIVEYLNCADVFVLPTKAEGCCNAIVEALACGLPVISSKKKFNDEILDENCSIRIDENDVNEIYEAIKMLKNDTSKCEIMSAGALKKAETLTIERRASLISRFFEEILGNRS